MLRGERFTLKSVPTDEAKQYRSCSKYTGECVRTQFGCSPLASPLPAFALFLLEPLNSTPIPHLNPDPSLVCLLG